MAISFEGAHFPTEIILRKACYVVPVTRLWVNPDCGLKTRHWDEIRPSLHIMVEAGAELRAALGVEKQSEYRGGSFDECSGPLRDD